MREAKLAGDQKNSPPGATRRAKETRAQTKSTRCGTGIFFLPLSRAHRKVAPVGSHGIPHSSQNPSGGAELLAGRTRGVPGLGASAHPPPASFGQRGVGRWLMLERESRGKALSAASEELLRLLPRGQPATGSWAPTQALWAALASTVSHLESPKPVAEHRSGCLPL